MSEAPDLTIDVEGLCKSYGERQVVSGLSLQVKRGEICGFLGANGSGKTTTIRMLCGLLLPDRGRGTCLGLDILKEAHLIRRQVGYMTQKFSFYEDLTVFENLEISFPRGRNVTGALFWKRSEEIVARVNEVARMIFLGDHIDRLAETLSHGQKQWLEIGMLLIQDPELLMLDEPVAGMSVSERTRTAELLERVSKGRSVIVIEHDMKFVESIADRVTVLHQGKVLAEGSMADIQENAQVKAVYLGH